MQPEPPLAAGDLHAAPGGAAAERFRALTRSFSGAQWRALAAIALEQIIGESTLAKVAELDGAQRESFLARGTESGLLVADRAPPAVPFAGALAEERWFSVHPDYEQLSLRELHRRGQLRAVAGILRDVLGARSVGAISLSLQEGDLEKFSRAIAAPRLPRRGPERTAAEWLRLSICEPWDPEWMEEVHGDAALPVAVRVLRESLDAPSPCDALFEWVKAHAASSRTEEARVTLASTLRQHALLRGTHGAPAGPAPALPRETALAFEAAAYFASGDAAAAHRTVQELLASGGGRGGRAGTVQCGAVAPIVALLAASRDEPEALAAAKRWVGTGTTEADRATARAFRTLLKYLELPEGTHRRIDAYQLDAGAGAWEILLYGLTVHLHLEAPATRASWATLVTRKAVRWHEAGYHWLARQALMLARDLSAEYSAQALADLHVDGAAFPARGNDASLWDLLAPKPEWKKALDALEAVGESVSERADADHRVAWYMDMTSGTLSRPALQEYRAQAGGWTAGRRVTLPELHEQRLSLPAEDARVLECTRETPDGKRYFTPEAYERLIGHPRVLDGARAGAPVEVVRGACRIETEEEAGYIRVLVEPEGAELGINVVPDGDRCLLVYRVTQAMARVMEALPRGVRVPKEHEADLVRVLGKLSQSVEVQCPQLGAERQVRADSTPCVRIAPYAGAWLVQIGVRPFGSAGRFFVAGIGRVSVTLAEGGARLRAERDFDAERSKVAALLAECPSLERDDEERREAEAAGEAHSFTFGEEGVLALLSELRDANTPHELEWPESPPLRLSGRVTRDSLHARLRCTKGWYLVTGGIRIDDVTEVALRELVRAPALAGGRFVRLSSGDYLEIEERVRRVMAALAAARHAPRLGPELRLHAGAAYVLQELAKPDSGVDVDGETKDWLARMSELASTEFSVPRELAAELRPYQREGYVWLCRLAALGLGACLADDMGLGKTVQIIALLLSRAAHGPALVVAPTSVSANWLRELGRFAPSLTPIEYAGKDRAALLPGLGEGGGKVVITSYALLQQDAAALASVSWGTAVLDEAQFIKNPKSLRAEAAFGLTAAFRIAATGTPVENHFGDLFGIFRFLNPGLLGEWADFNRTFIQPVERGGAAEPEVVLRNIVRPYILRRRKRDVLSELPPLTEVQHDVHLTQDEALRYALLRRQVHDKLFTAAGKQDNKIQVLAEITRLRRFCCHPRLTFADAGTESSKVRAFLELAEELRDNDRRALVFSQYVDFLGLVREELDERRISYEYLDGSTPAAARQARVDAFQNGAATLFLISLKAGGFGLNLTGADTVIHLDPWWNPAVEAQATDRSHRIGQARPVTVYRLVTRNTIEEKIVELHGKKQRLAEGLLEGTEEAASLGGEELLELIAVDGSGDLHE